MGTRQPRSTGDWRFGGTPRYGKANPQPVDRPPIFDWAAWGALGPDAAPYHRVGWLASQQHGEVGSEQLRWLGVDTKQVARWVARGQLHRVLPGVYAVGHTAPSFEADLIAALLYAGPGAALSDHTAAWWLGLTGRRPVTIDVATPRRCRSLDGIRVHDRRPRTRVWLDRLPVTTPTDLLLDIAAKSDLNQVRYLLSQVEYRRLATLVDVEAALGPGRAGSALLRRAIRRHLPQLARTLSPTEIDFLLLCEHYGIPIPEVNVKMFGFIVDAAWINQRLIVELDGAGGHDLPSQRERDRQRDLIFRQHGFLVLRYTAYQVKTQARAIAADIQAALQRPVTRAA